jgi:hypothetical protein
MDVKSFITLGPGRKVIKLFQSNYIAIGITSVKIIGKYTASGVKLCLKKFYNIGAWQQCYKAFYRRHLGIL